MAEGLARGLLGGEESGQALGPIPLASGVPHLVFCVYLSREPREGAIVEPVALHLGEIDPDANDHGCGFGGGDKFSGNGRRRTRSEMESKIRIVPINVIESAFLDRLGLCLEERYLATVRVERALAVPRSTLNATRGQLFLSTLFARTLRGYPQGEGTLLAITTFDLYKTSHRFIYGDADEQQGIAAVSLHRLYPEFYGAEPDANLLFQRTLTECVHELGHAFGLKHCFNPKCSMYYSNSIFEVDSKTPHYCEVCDRRISRTRQ
jgi:archaemetzincin